MHSVSQPLQFLVDFNTYLEDTRWLLGLDRLCSSLHRLRTEHYLLAQSVADAHHSPETAFARIDALESTIHYEEKIRRVCCTFLVDELICFKLLYVGVVYEVLESFQGQLREEWVPQTYILKDQLSLFTFLINEIFIILY